MFQLRQLEEQRRANAGDGDGGPAAHHQHSKSLPAAALQHVQAKGSLMDRLNLLESRIRQLSCELDVAAAAGGSSVPAVARPAEDRAWSEPPLPEPCKHQVHFLYKGARQLHRTKPNTSTVT